MGRLLLCQFGRFVLCARCVLCFFVVLLFFYRLRCIFSRCRSLVLSPGV